MHLKIATDPQPNHIWTAFCWRLKQDAFRAAIC